MVSEPASFGTSWGRVTLFHLLHLYTIYQVTNYTPVSPACACNNVTEGLFFEWERVFHHVFHCNGTVEQTVRVVVPMARCYNSISPREWCQ